MVHLRNAIMDDAAPASVEQAASPCHNPGDGGSALPVIDPEPTPTRSTRLSVRLERLRSQVTWHARATVAAVAVAVTLGTWGPWMILPFGLSTPRWERFVYKTSGPYCHQLAARSYHVAGHVLPLCTRCTGMWIGITLGVAFAMIVVPRQRWWIGTGLAVIAAAASAFDKLREEATRTDAPDVRFVLGVLVFVGVTLAVSFDTLAVLLGLLRAIARLPRTLRSRSTSRQAG